MSQSNQALGTGQTLTKRVRSGLSWNAGAMILGQASSFLRSIVIARLLFPEDFGLFGMALTVSAALNAFTTIGLDQSIIAGKFKTEEALNSHLNTVWSAELLRTTFLALLMTASAYPIARFYGQPKLHVLIPLLSLSTLIQGFRNIGLVVFRKEVSFSRIFWCEGATNVLAATLTIGLLLFFPNVWTLVFGHIITTAANVFFSYVFHPYRPKLILQKQSLQAVFRLGRFPMVIAITSYITTMADNIVVALVLGTEALGHYAMAYNLASVPIAILVYTFGAVMFPAYAELAARNPERVAGAMKSAFSIICLLLFTITVPLLLLAPDIVELLYGRKWALAGSTLRVLALLIPLRGGMLIISTLFFGLNKLKLLASGKTLETILFLLILYPLTKFLGLKGAAFAGVIVYGLAFVNRCLALERIIPGSAASVVRFFLYSILAAGIGLMIGAASLTLSDSVPVRFVLGGLLPAIVCAGVLMLLSVELRTWTIEMAGLSLKKQDAAV